MHLRVKGFFLKHDWFKSGSLYYSLYLYIYIHYTKFLGEIFPYNYFPYMYLCICMCVCVCVYIHIYIRKIVIRK